MQSSVTLHFSSKLGQNPLDNLLSGPSELNAQYITERLNMVKQHRPRKEQITVRLGEKVLTRLITLSDELGQPLATLAGYAIASYVKQYEDVQRIQEKAAQLMADKLVDYVTPNIMN